MSSLIPKQDHSVIFLLTRQISMYRKDIIKLSHRYPQILLPIEQNIKDTPEYKDAVLRGKAVSREPAFIGSPEDLLSSVTTPVGTVDVLYLANREDFEHALRALAYRCEPVSIPASVGASTVRGLINWQKIKAHKYDYILSGGTDWSEELKRFTSNRKNYLDTVIILSSGNYSALPACAVGLPESVWREKSFVIRKYHELTHFVCRTLYPENIEPVRDEVIADMIGMTAAFGHYDPKLAKQFLGIDGNQFRSGGRLAHYVENGRLSNAMSNATDLIERFASQNTGFSTPNIFDLMLTIIHTYYRKANI